MTELINIQSYILDYILEHRWKDYDDFANKISKEIIKAQPSTQKELISIIKKASSDFFYFNNISKKKFIEYFPFENVLMELDESNKSQKQITVLYLATNPKDTKKLRLDEEIREMNEAVQKGEFRDKINIQQAWAVRISDLQSLLLKHHPEIVHFSGHGDDTSQIVLEDRNGYSIAVPPKALTSLFSLFEKEIKVVILNACFSEKQANAISKKIQWVIGMSDSISDEAAIAFSKAFYLALAYGKTIEEAYQFGINQIELFNLGEENIPKLLKKPRC